MKTNPIYRLAGAASCGLFLLLGACAEDKAPRTFCRFVPERSDDFAWENDKIAFRAYGPALRDSTENGGVDCWLKRVNYPIIDKWYSKHVAGGTYHEDQGEGYDPYHVGASLGCGGIGLWTGEGLVTTETFVDWRIISCEPLESVFELDYAWEHDGHQYTATKRMRIGMGSRLFKTTATFRMDGEPAGGLPVAIGITTHDGVAEASANVEKGWMACWETIDGSGLGTGVAMEPSRILEYKLLESETPDLSHALFLAETDEAGQVSWWSGYGWERAGEIDSFQAWQDYLDGFVAVGLSGN